MFYCLLQRLSEQGVEAFDRYMASPQHRPGMQKALQARALEYIQPDLPEEINTKKNSLEARTIDTFVRNRRSTASIVSPTSRL